MKVRQNPAIRKTLLSIAGLLGLRRPLMKLYRFCFAPNGGTTSVSVLGHEAFFHVYSAEGAQALKSLGGERPSIEMLMSELHPGDCFYDIGASNGLYSVYLGGVVANQGQVVAFEPEPQTFERLQENVKLNELTNVQCLKLALGDTEGVVSIRVGNVAGASRIEQGDHPNERAASRENVRVEVADRLIRARSLPPPTAVKIDVEGFEYAVIKGMSETLADNKCRLVCCEVHPDFLPEGINPDEVSQLLRSLGFRRLQTYQRSKDFHIWAKKS